MGTISQFFVCFICCFSLLVAEETASNKTLDQIALETGTDKSSIYHNYTSVYTQYFAPLQKHPLKFLEIGIYKGDSVRLWEQYFPNAELHFIDIDASNILYWSTRSHYHFVDQSNFTQLTQFAQSIGGGLDIIIDDGGHTMVQQITSFKALFPYLKSGGIYIIEDLNTSYWKAYGGLEHKKALNVKGRTTVAFLQDLVHELNYIGSEISCADQEKFSLFSNKELNEYQKEIYSIHFYSSLCIILKK